MKKLITLFFFIPSILLAQTPKKTILVAGGSGSAISTADSAIYKTVSKARQDSFTLMAAIKTKAIALTKIYYARDFGLVGDSTTDDTNAFQAMIDSVSSWGGGRILFDAKIYLIAGALKNTTGTGSNSQIALPAVSLTSPMVVITLEGVQPPPIQFFTWNSYGIYNAVTVFKSTLTGASGEAAVFAGPWSSAIAPRQNNVQLNLINLVCVAPPNPTFTFFNLKDQQANITENVLIYAGTTNLNTITQPTNSNAYGYKFPNENHTPNTIIRNLRVMGFYCGIQISESIFAEGVRLSGCWKGIDAIFGYHISVFKDLAIYWTPYGITSTTSSGDNKNRLRVIGYGMEHRGTSGGASWMDNVWDIDDPNGNLVGDLEYVSVTGGVGNTASFTKNGGANFNCRPVGWRLKFNTGLLTYTNDTIRTTLSVGIPTGQSVIGATTSAGYLDILSTTHATKGKIYLGTAHTSAFDEANERLGIGTGSPSNKLDITQNLAGELVAQLNNTNSASSSAASSWYAVANTTSGVVKAYPSGFTVGSLANTVGFGPGNSTTRGMVIFSNNTALNGGVGYLSFRGGGYDSTAEKIRVTKDGVVIGGAGTITPSNALDVVGNINLTTAGNKIKIATGSNASAGTGTFSSGTATISTTAVTASSLIFIQHTSCSSCGVPYISTKTAGTSFVVTSNNASDASTFNWWIIN